MSQVEAAASLFGSSDSGSDFLSVSECESPSDPAAGTSSNDDFYSSSSQAASKLFDSGEGQAEDSSLFAPEDHARHEVSDNVNGTQFSQPEANSPSQYFNYGGHTDYYGGNPLGENSYDSYDSQASAAEAAQEAWQGVRGSQQQHQGANIYDPNYYSTGNSSKTVIDKAGTYSYAPGQGPYAPQNALYSGYNNQASQSSPMYGSQTLGTVPAPQINVAAHVSTDPYSPSNYAPVGAGAAPSSTLLNPVQTSSQFDAYKPSLMSSRSTPALKPSYGNTYAAFSSTATEQPVKSIPPPRPTLSNAYDPPMPTNLKKSKSAFQTFHGPSPPVQSPYSNYVNNGSYVDHNSHGTQGQTRNPGPPRTSLPPRSQSTQFSNGPTGMPYHRSASPFKSTNAAISPSVNSYTPPTNPPNISPLPRSPPQHVANLHSPPSVYAPIEQYGSRQHEVTNPVNAFSPDEATHRDSWNASSGHDAHGTSNGFAHDDFAGDAEGGLSNFTQSYVGRTMSPSKGMERPPLSPRSTVARPYSPSKAPQSRFGVVRTSSPLGAYAQASTSPASSRLDHIQNDSGVSEDVAQYGPPYSHITRAPVHTERTKSPTGGSIHSHDSGDIYAPPATSSALSYANEGQNVVDLTESDTSSIYGVSTSPSTRALSTAASSGTSQLDAAGSPIASFQTNPFTGRDRSPSPHKYMHHGDPYAPSSIHQVVSRSEGDSVSRMRSGSTTSTFSSSTAYDPYAPSHTSRPSVGNDFPPALPSAQRSSAQSVYAPHSVHAPASSSATASHSPPPIIGPYAPSPSLLGTNDPLGRSTARVPIIQFGFGGKMITCFHSAPSLDTGFDVALTSQKCTAVTIRSLQTFLPESVIDASTVAFPGPLFGDSGSPTAALAIASHATSAKQRKGKVLTYLKERIKELEQGVGYHYGSSSDRRHAEGKLVLVRLLHTMVEHDGQLTGSTPAVAAARKALLPTLPDSSTDSDGILLNAPTAATFASRSFEAGSNTLPSTGSESPVAQYVVRPSALDKITMFLLQGEMRQAYHYALDERMWAHAMLIAYGLGKDSFKEVADEFIRTELGAKSDQRQGAPLSTKLNVIANGRESLRLAYGLYSGQAPSTVVQQLLPSRISNGSMMTTLTVQPPTPINHVTPISPGFPSAAVAMNVAPEALSKWQEYAAMFLSVQTGVDSAALTTLGDYLVSNDWVAAGHCCYLLSPHTSLFGGLGTPSARIVLLGAQSPQTNMSAHKDPDCFTFSEIVEYALSLRAPTKGQEQFTGLPYLQAYRLVRAQQFAELGQMVLAKRYCDAISSCTNRASPYLTPTFVEQLGELVNRLNGNPDVGKGSSWIGGKIAKPSLDSIGGWLGGTLTKFVAGESESSPRATGENAMSESASYSGAFQHYSSISSANTSKSPSPTPSLANTTAPANMWRPGSATAHRSLYNPQTPVDRASSAFDHIRSSRKSTPPPRVASASAATTTFAESRSFSQPAQGYGYTDTYSSLDQGRYTSNTVEADDSRSWNGAYSDSGGPTPTGVSFVNLDAPSTSESSFMSRTESRQSAAPPTSSTPVSHHIDEEDLEEDLGFGNATHKAKQPLSDETNSATKKEAEPAKTESAQPKKPEIKPSASSSWLGRLWSRGPTPNASSPGPVKANLGEENSFYYDKELKRWVNKKGGVEATKVEPLPPPPPSRAQTTSPTRASLGSKSTPAPAPPRPMSAMEPGMPPPSKSLRVQSNLVPNSLSDSAPPTPSTPSILSGMSNVPPTGRSKSVASARKNIRSRYVDVFQTGNA